jgi:uncharacterized membrane protein YdjX (TVP38/TMEM64 family)
MPPEKDKTPSAISNKRASRKKNIIKLVIFALIVLIVGTLSHKYHLNELINYDAISEKSETLKEWAHRPYGPILFIVIAASFILLHLPEIVVIVAGGLIYDHFWQSMLYSWIGCNLGISLAFLIARFFLRDYFKPHLDNSFLAKYDLKLEKEGFIIVLILRLVLFLFPPLTWAIGASAIKTRDYLISSALGVTPWLVAVLMTVSSLQDAKSFSDLLNLQTVTVVGSFGTVFVAVFFIRRKYFSDR